MKWYIVIKIFYVVHSTLGPYETKDECIQQMIQYYDYAKSRYDQGERIYIGPLEVHPNNVKAQCKQK